MTELIEPPQETNIKKVLMHTDGTWEIYYQCPFCPCRWSTLYDFDLHMEAFSNNKGEHTKKIQAIDKKHSSETEPTWYPSKFGNGEWLMLQEKDPDLTQRLKQVGTVVTSKYSYKLNGKWIIKKQIGA
jgi:hypothetical protein